ncbi:MAG: response regulator transcription factor [Armatimonadetes bacterium]|nr:response regulator transcription factor [Armatimonadota bacterium]
MEVVIGIPHALLRDGLRDLLKRWSGISVAGVAPSAREAVRVAERTEPDVLIMARSARPAEDARALEALRTTRRRCRIVLLEETSRPPRDDALVADWRVPPSVGPSGLVKGLWELCAAKTGAAPADLGRPARTPPQPKPHLILTRREHEVVRAVCEGLSNKLIAQRLGISEKTVKNHLFSIYRRTNVSGRTQLMLWALKRGLGASGPPADT